MRAIFIDLETADADQFFTYGPDFVRLAGYAVNDGPVRLTTDMSELVREIEGADVVAAHNAIGFDLAALEHWHGLDVGALVEAGRVRDTLLLARQAWPPAPGDRCVAVDGHGYSLDHVARRLGADGKLSAYGQSVLKRLKAEFGGFDQIPVNHPDYRRYLEQDVRVLRDVAMRLPVDEYLLREHRAMWRLQHISRSGFRVDTAELARRRTEQETHQTALKARFAERFDLDGAQAAPHRTAAGKSAIESALRAAGAEPPRTAKGGLATGAEALRALAAAHPDNAGVAEVCEVVAALNSQRTTLDTIAHCLRPDGRVHPQVSARQASGRISVTEPGMTVLGKRARRNVLERALLLPDPGDVLLTVDLSQIDARAIAALAQDSSYLAAFAPGKDLHSENAERILGDRSRRSDAKALSHAINYGMGARKLAQTTGKSEHEAAELLARLTKAYPMLSQFKDRVRAEAQHTHVLSNVFGRRMSVVPGREYTQAPALAGQGTARDLLVEGILRLPREALSRLRAVVHDEIVLSVPERSYEECRRQVLDALQFDFTPWPGAQSVPVLAESGAPGRDWVDCYRDERPEWPEVARAHREQDDCDDEECTWHRRE